MTRHLRTIAATTVVCVPAVFMLSASMARWGNFDVMTPAYRVATVALALAIAVVHAVIIRAVSIGALAYVHFWYAIRRARTNLQLARAALPVAKDALAHALIERELAPLSSEVRAQLDRVTDRAVESPRTEPVNNHVDVPTG